MQIYEELVARGLIAQVTNEEEIRKMVNEGKAVFYIGFDPTADSHLETFHQAQCHEMSHMKAVCGRIKTDVEGSLSVIDQFLDLLFICQM